MCLEKIGPHTKIYVNHFRFDKSTYIIGGMCMIINKTENAHFDK